MLSFERLLWYDVFISYSHSGAEHYAASLARKFRDFAYRPFLASGESKPGGLLLEDWLTRALRRSQILVLFAEPIALKSRWVAWEIEAFSASKPDAVLITISIERTVQDSDLSGTSFKSLRDRVYLSENTEALSSGQPSIEVLERILGTLKAVDKGSARRRLFYVIISALILAFVAGVVVGKSLP
jgi:TIR domain